MQPRTPVKTSGPLRAHPDNPRYFADSQGQVVYLTGSHTWNTLQDLGFTDPPPVFDFAAYLDLLARHGHNFIRLWRWELPKNSARGDRTQYCQPHPWQRMGPGTAWDNKPRFDLDQFDLSYFDRLRSRVTASRDRGIYVSIMLFEGWGLRFSNWDGHPFNAGNNVNGIDGDPDRDGRGLQIQTLDIPAVTAVQEAYVRQVVEAVGDLDNVLYEISNEARTLGPDLSSRDWQYHMIRFVKTCEAARSQQHPVGMTSQGFGGGDDSDILLAGPADWISPNPDRHDYKHDPPMAAGAKVVILDTDHLWGVGGDRTWVWKSFLRGYNPIWMDPYDARAPFESLPAQTEDVRRNLGYARQCAGQLDLAATTPQPHLSSTGYCLAHPGEAYLVYLPEGGVAEVDLRGASGSLAVEWFDPAAGRAVDRGSVPGGERRAFQAPFVGDAVLFLTAQA